MWPRIHVILSKCAIRVGVYLWMEDMFHVFANVLSASRV